MKKVIITGANGQDGVILSKLLIKKRYLVFKFIKKKIKSNKINYFITANKKFNNAALTLPKCIMPVGDGANLTLIFGEIKFNLAP